MIFQLDPNSRKLSTNAVGFSKVLGATRSVSPIKQGKNTSIKLVVFVTEALQNILLKRKYEIELPSRSDDMR